MATLYVHIPFRTAPRLYDEATTVIEGRVSSSYVESVSMEIAYLESRYGTAEPIESIYFGGGRPSLLTADDLRILRDRMNASFDIENAREVTLELNPLDATPSYLQALQTLGINRVSLETLSFQPDDLRTMQTPHGLEDIERAWEALEAAGFRHVSMDLAFGWDGQDELHWKANLERAVRLEVPHLSLVEWTGGEVLPPASEAFVADQYEFAMDYLSDRGYEQYEISHFALPGARSVHNERNWDHSNSLGVGAGAHSFWWDELPAFRWHNVGNRSRYEALLDQRHLPIAERRALDLPELALEYVLLQLRTGDGIDLDYLRSQYDLDLMAERSETITQLLEADYVERSDTHRICLTDRGRLVADAVAKRLLPPDHASSN